MKCNLKKRAARLLALSLVIAVTICFVPQTAAPAYAESDDPASAAPAMVEGAESVLKDTANTDDAQKVHYAGQSWWVISYGDEGNEYLKSDEPEVMTLFATESLSVKDEDGEDIKTVQFSTDCTNEANTYYAGSILQGYVDGLFDNGTYGLFSPKEQQPVISRTLEVEAYKPYDDGRPFCNGIAGSEVTCKLWPLSAAEADSGDYYAEDPEADKGAMPASIACIDDAYWLRSPGHIVTLGETPQYTVARMDDRGLDKGDEYPDNYCGIRPAFYLDPDSILFTSAAEGVGASGKLAEVGENTTGEWKLTLKDDGSLGGGLDGHADFEVNNDEAYYIPGTGEVGISYSGAATGENEYISAIVKDSDGNVTHYGRLQKATEASDELIFKVDDSILEGGTVYLFNEQYNGDKKTDYASALKEVKIPEPIKVPVVIGVAGAASDLMNGLAGSESEGVKAELNDAGDTIFFSLPVIPGRIIETDDFIDFVELALSVLTDENYDGYLNKYRLGYREIYDSEDEFNADVAANSDKAIEDGMTFYVQWERPVKRIEITVDVPKCGYRVTGDSEDEQDPKPTLTKIEGEGIDQNSDMNSCYWWSRPSADSGRSFAGKVEAGDALDVRTTLNAKYDYYFVDPDTIECYINGVKAESAIGTKTSITFAGSIDVTEHDWGPWTVTKEPTETAEGAEIRECKSCHKTETRSVPAKGYAPGEDPDQKGDDGTAVGPGASAASADKAITSMKKDVDPAGSVFAKLKLKSPKQTKKSIKLKWTKVSKATKYVIYGNKCGKTNKPKKLATVKGTTKTFKKVAGKKIKKGKYYKFIVVALDKDNNVVSTSKLIHVATKGGKVGNHKKVTVKKSVIKKAKKLKKGKSLKLKAKAVPKSKKLKVRIHVKVRYESTNKKIATVSKKGVVKAKGKGTCYVYAYAQNGVFKKIKVTVK